MLWVGSNICIQCSSELTHKYVTCMFLWCQLHKLPRSLHLHTSEVKEQLLMTLTYVCCNCAHEQKAHDQTAVQVLLRSLGKRSISNWPMRDEYWYDNTILLSDCSIPNSGGLSSNLQSMVVGNGDSFRLVDDLFCDVHGACLCSCHVDAYILMHVEAWAGPYAHTWKYTGKINLPRRGQWLPKQLV